MSSNKSTSPKICNGIQRKLLDLKKFIVLKKFMDLKLCPRVQKELKDLIFYDPFFKFQKRFMYLKNK